jgi:hypothetical protein
MPSATPKQMQAFVIDDWGGELSVGSAPVPGFDTNYSQGGT